MVVLYRVIINLQYSSTSSNLASKHTTIINHHYIRKCPHERYDTGKGHYYSSLEASIAGPKSQSCYASLQGNTTHHYRTAMLSIHPFFLYPLTSLSPRHPCTITINITTLGMVTCYSIQARKPFASSSPHMLMLVDASSGKRGLGAHVTAASWPTINLLSKNATEWLTGRGLRSRAESGLSMSIEKALLT